jgi:predicted MFS family arabinose efflux permease
MSPETAASTPRLDGGRTAWSVALGACIGLAVAFGPAFIASFGLYLKPIAAELGRSRTDIGWIYSLVAIMGALGTPALGFLLDSRGARGVIIAASIALPAVLLLLALVPATMTAFLLCAIAIGFVSIIASPTAWVSLLPQWFSRRLGVAVAIAMVGSGFGQFAMVRAHGALLSSLDWRSAWMIMAAVVAAIGIPVALLMARDRPDLTVLRRTAATATIEGLPLGQSLRSPVFWTAVPAFFLVMLVTAAMLTHLAPLLTDRGWSVERAAGVVSIIGLVSLAGRAASGALLDRIGFGLLGVLIFPLPAVSCLLLLSDSSDLSIHIAAALIGLAYGVEADMLPWLLRNQFGLRAFGRLYGIGFGVVQLGSVLGPLVMGLSFDHLGGYGAGLTGLSLASGLSFLMIAAAALISARRQVNG